MLLDEGPELPRGHAAAVEVGARDDGRRARAAVDQGDLAEMLARPEGANDLAADADGGVALLDDEEPDPALSLAGDLVALVEAALGHPLAELLQLLGLDPREERDPLQRLIHISHCGRDLIPVVNLDERSER